jgi:hypothetical protein
MEMNVRRRGVPLGWILAALFGSQALVAWAFEAAAGPGLLSGKGPQERAGRVVQEAE